MYAWIWRHLPFGRLGKIISSVVITGLVVALLWYVVFPWAEPLLPFDDVQVTDNGNVPGGDVGDEGGPGVEPSSGEEHDLPYSTTTNNPQPTSGR